MSLNGKNAFVNYQNYPGSMCKTLHAGLTINFPFLHFAQIIGSLPDIICKTSIASSPVSLEK
ncbi:MAG TPA: hypothetical protein DCQ26_14810 [Marinilabiliales bacterium]|nr:hypothetical protein [Marinilabiliales bacterium]